MDIKEAYAAALRGHRITHESFTDNEFLEIRYDDFVTEDQVPFAEEFFKRKQENWDQHWRIWDGGIKTPATLELVCHLTQFLEFPRDINRNLNIAICNDRPYIRFDLQQAWSLIPVVNTLQESLVYAGATESKVVELMAAFAKVLGEAGFTLTADGTYKDQEGHYLIVTPSWKPRCRTFEQWVEWFK